MPNLSPISSNNTTQAAPYYSTAEGLLYEILMAFGGPGQGGQMPFLPENPTGAPPYRSTTEGLLYEILGAVKAGGGGGGGGTSQVTSVNFGTVPAAITVNAGHIAAASLQKIIIGTQSYQVAPPTAVLTPNTQHKLFIAEPTTEPIKSGFLWFRNLGSTYIRPVATVTTVGAYRVYTFAAQDAANFLPQYAGPVYLSTTAAMPAPPAGIEVIYNLRLLSNTSVQFLSNNTPIFTRNTDGNYNGLLTPNPALNQSFSVVLNSTFAASDWQFDVVANDAFLIFDQSGIDSPSGLVTFDLPAQTTYTKLEITIRIN